MYWKNTMYHNDIDYIDTLDSLMLMNINLIILMWNMSQFNINQCDHNIFHNGRHYKPSSNSGMSFDFFPQGLTALVNWYNKVVSTVTPK